MNLKLTPFKFPFVALEAAVCAVMAQYAYQHWTDPMVVLGCVTVGSLAVYAILYILSDEVE